MVVRIYTVTINENLKEEFQKDFEEVVNSMSQSCEGLISCEIIYPNDKKPNDYQLITKWKDKESLFKFVGEEWDKVVIPEHMQRYHVSSSVEHQFL